MGFASGPLSERNSISIPFYNDLILGDLDKARGVYEIWAQMYPRDDNPVGNMGLLNGYLGQYEKALTHARDALNLHRRAV